MTSPQKDPKNEPVKVEKAATAAVPAAGGAKVVGSAPAPAPAGAQTGRRPPGAKEVIPFEWKLIGEANGLALTLFKAIEREDVEAQLERVQREGYYGNLRILGNTEKVKQPASPKSGKAVRKEAGTKTTIKVKKAAVKRQKVLKNPPATKAAASKPRPKPKPKTAKASKAKATRKSAKKKTAAKKAVRKKSAKKKAARKSRR